MSGQLRLLGGQKLQSPPGINTRPTTSLIREALINIIGPKLINSSWLDLFSGSGIIGCEALLRGAKKVVAVELNRKTYNICNSNLVHISNEIISNPSIKTINYEVINWLRVGHQKQHQKLQAFIPSNGFDFVYLDPPYKIKIYSLVLNHLLLGNWLHKKSLVICESSNKYNFELSNKWLIQDERAYGNSKLIFLIPNLA